MDEKIQYPKFLPELIRDYEVTSDLYKKCLKEMFRRSISGSLYLKPLQNTKMLGLCKIILEYLLRNKIIIKEDEFNELFGGFINGQGIIPLSIIVPFFKEKDPKIFVLQKTFFEKFKKVKFNMIQYKHLPQNALGYVQFPEPIIDRFSKKEYYGFFYYCGPLDKVQNKYFQMQQERTYEFCELDSTNIFAVAFFDCEYELYFEWRYFPLDLEMSVAESFKNITRAEATENGLKTTFIPEGFDSNLAIMVNTIAYIHSGDPDIRTVKNHIRYQSPTSLTPVKADKHLSRANIIEVGFSHKKERLKHTDEWYSMAHMGWRRCGPGRSQIKLCLIKGSMKQWKKIKE